MRYIKEKQGDKWVVRVFWTVYSVQGLKKKEFESITYRGDEKGADETIKLLEEIYGKQEGANGGG